MEKISSVIKRYESEVSRLMASKTEDKKCSDAIALIWQGKLHFNHAIYLEDITACNETINL